MTPNDKAKPQVWFNTEDDMFETAEDVVVFNHYVQHEDVEKFVKMSAFTALQEEIEWRKKAYSDLDDVNIKLNEQIAKLKDEMLNSGKFAQDQENKIAKLKEAYGVVRKALKDAQRIERDRIFEDLRCPGLDGSMKIETRYDEALAKAEEGLKCVRTISCIY